MTKIWTLHGQVSESKLPLITTDEIFTKCFEIRKYQTSYWNINMKTHWKGFMGILTPKAVYLLKSYWLLQQVCQSNYHVIVKIMPVNSQKILFS